MMETLKIFRLSKYQNLCNVEKHVYSRFACIDMKSRHV